MCRQQSETISWLVRGTLLLVCRFSLRYPSRCLFDRYTQLFNQVRLRDLRQKACCFLRFKQQWVGVFTEVPKYFNLFLWVQAGFQKVRHPEIFRIGRRLMKHIPTFLGLPKPRWVQMGTATVVRMRDLNFISTQSDFSPHLAVTVHWRLHLARIHYPADSGHLPIESQAPHYDLALNLTA